MSSVTNPTLDADRAALAELRDLGMDMARLTVARARADAEDGEDIDRTPAFDRVNRGVRRAVFLLQHIATAAAKTRADGARSERYRVNARCRVIRDIEDATCRKPKPEQDAVAAELAERLDSPEFDDDLAGMTAAQASELIRRDFGLGQIFVHKRRTPAEIQALAARARHSAHRAAPPPEPPGDEPPEPSGDELNEPSGDEANEPPGDEASALLTLLRHEARGRNQR